MAKLSAAGAIFTELVLEVFKINGLLLEAGDRLTRPVGLSSARWQVLGVVEHGPVPVANVARVMGLSRQSVQQTADALAREGFIEYIDNPHHRRAKLMVLKPQGRRALDAVVKRHAGWASGLGEHIKPAALRAALEALRTTRLALEEDT